MLLPPRKTYGAALIRAGLLARKVGGFGVAGAQKYDTGSFHAVLIPFEIGARRTDTAHRNLLGGCVDEHGSPFLGLLITLPQVLGDRPAARHLQDDPSLMQA